MAVLLERRQLENLPLSPIGKKGGLCVQDGQDGAKIVDGHIFERRSRPPRGGVGGNGQGASPRSFEA
jgi:hypothetical protein